MLTAYLDPGILDKVPAFVLQFMLRAHRTIPACKPECALQGRETVMTFMIGECLEKA